MLEQSFLCPLALLCTGEKVMEALGVGIGLKTVCIVGGIDMFQQVTLHLVVGGGRAAGVGGLQ